MERIISLVIGYAFGLIQTSYIIGRIKGIDIRTKGSGNAGTTNTLRVLGLKAGIITLAVDILKCIAAAVVVRAIYRSTGLAVLYGVYACAGTVLGHDFPFYLGFKGGKGVACFGANAIYSGPVNFFVLLAVFLASCIFTGYVSVGSLLVGLGFLVLNVITVLTGRPAGWGKHLTFAPGCGIEIILLSTVMLAIIVHRHKANIERLLSGTENKFTFGKKEGKDRAPERPF